MGAIYLENGNLEEEDDTLSLVRWFLEHELEKPLVVRKIEGDTSSAHMGAETFQELFSMIQKRQKASEEQQV